MDFDERFTQYRYEHTICVPKISVQSIGLEGSYTPDGASPRFWWNDLLERGFSNAWNDRPLTVGILDKSHDSWLSDATNRFSIRHQKHEKEPFEVKISANIAPKICRMECIMPIPPDIEMALSHAYDVQWHCCFLYPIAMNLGFCQICWGLSVTHNKRS